MKKLSVTTADGVTVELEQSTIVDLFHELYYDSKVWGNTFWFGNQILKCPLDMWVYQELFFEIKPDVVVECGSFKGGSALFYANLFDLMGKGHVVSVDVERYPNLPVHPRITYVTGSSTDPEISNAIAHAIGPNKCVAVILDSDHSRDHVLAEMRTYASFVNPGSYMIVEDSNVNGHPTRPDFGPGPMEAIDLFLQENDQFEIDRSKEKFYMTLNPRGYLKKKLPTTNLL